MLPSAQDFWRDKRCHCEKEGFIFSVYSLLYNSDYVSSILANKYRVRWIQEGGNLRIL